MKKLVARLLLALAVCSTLPLTSSARLFAQGVSLALPVVQFVDGNGVPYSGGQLFSYDAGTLVAHATFTDSTLGTPNANPVVLDANGRAVVYLAAVNYKFILKNALSSTVWTQDNVPALSSYNVVPAAVSTAIALVQPASLTIATAGNVTALTLPVGNGPLIIRCNNTTLLTLQGIAPGLAGQRLSLISIGNGQVDLSGFDGAAPATNRIVTFVTVGKTSLAAATGTAELTYDPLTSRWYVLAHEQGAWITRTFAAGNYTAIASLWTVAAATNDSFYLRGRTLTYAFTVTGTTSATPIGLQILMPGGYLAAKQTNSAIYVTDASVGSGGFVQSLAGSGTIQGNKFNTAAWTAAAGAALQGELTLEVQ
jgi:hypothetical protein